MSEGRAAALRSDPSDAMLCGTAKRNFPAGKHEHGGMAIVRTGKNLCALDTQVHPAVLDGGDGGLPNARKFGQLALAQFLEFPQDTDGLSHRDLDSLFRRTILLHLDSCSFEDRDRDCRGP